MLSLHNQLICSYNFFILFSYYIFNLWLKQPTPQFIWNNIGDCKFYWDNKNIKIAPLTTLLGNFITRILLPITNYILTTNHRSTSLIKQWTEVLNKISFLITCQTHEWFLHSFKNSLHFIILRVAWHHLNLFHERLRCYEVKKKNPVKYKLLYNYDLSK